jgi:ankyrin repeat protein
MRTNTTLAAAAATAVAVLAAPHAALAQARVVDAVRDGNRAAARQLITKRADVNLPEADGTTALHWAARSGDDELVALLLQQGAKADVTNRYGLTPLLLAAGNGDARVLERLLTAGADVRTATAEGQTAILLAARSGSADAIRVLAAHGADVNAAEGWMGETPLIWAAAENNAAAIKTLVELGAKVDTRSATIKYPAQKPADPSNYVSSSVPPGQWTALMYAARQGGSEAVRTLLDLGASINVQDPEGFTPLLQAIVNGHFDLAAMLVQRGANPNLADKSGMGALYATIEMRTPPWERSRPDIKEDNDLDCVGLMKVLLEHGADVNQTLTGRTLQRYHANGPAYFGAGTTPLMRAAKFDNLDMIQVLVAHGADVTRTQPDGTTALMLAAGVKFTITQEGDPEKAGTPDDAFEIAKLLVERGADVNASNAKGETALYGAALTGRDRVISYLAEKGGRLDARTKTGLSLLDAALNVGVSDDGTGTRVGGKPGGATVALVRDLMTKAGISTEPAAKAGAGTDGRPDPDRIVPGTRPARQTAPAGTAGPR